EYKLRPLALPFFQFGNAVLFVVIPIVSLIDETDHARIAQRKTTENGGAVKSECARFVDSKISDHLFLVGTRLTFECFYSEVNRINFDELHGEDEVHLHRSREIPGDVAIVRSFESPINF